jgi:hypothetical protein
MAEFDLAHRIFVSYIDKSRRYYLALGYANPYRWAHYENAPLAMLAKPLNKCRVGLITTAALAEEAAALNEVYAARTDPPPVALYTNHRSWDKKATHTRDVESFLPIRRVSEFVAEERIGSLSSRFYGAPTQFSQRLTIEKHAPLILDLCRADQVDVALLVPL